MLIITHIQVLNVLERLTGLDLVNETYILSIGTNPNLTFLLQMFLWLSLLFIFTKKRDSKLHLSFYPSFIIPVLFVSQHYFESRFYKNSIYFRNVDFKLLLDNILFGFLFFTIDCLNIFN